MKRPPESRIFTSRRWSLILPLLLLLDSLQAQLIVNLQLPPDGITRKSQLWNMSLVNNGTANLELKINMVLTDRTTSQPVLTAVTRSITLTPGVRQIQANELLPITYNIVSSAYNIDQSPDGYLPVGRFKVCYAFIGLHHNAGLGEDCVQIEVDPLSPPQLSSPVDREEIETLNPALTWIPPMPLNLFNNLSYDLAVVEMYRGQTMTDAIQKNIPLFTQAGLNDLLVTYPASAPPLQPGKKYAWQVKVRNNGVVAAQTEVWTFSVKKTLIPAGDMPFNGSGYVKLQKSGSIPYSVSHGELTVEYNNEANDTAVQMQIHDLSATDRNTLQLTASVRFGQNFLKIDPQQDHALKEGHIYLLQLINSRREKWNLKFQFVQKN